MLPQDFTKFDMNDCTINRSANKYTQLIGDINVNQDTPCLISLNIIIREYDPHQWDVLHFCHR